jgi:nickel-dependent lactate racemase
VTIDLLYGRGTLTVSPPAGCVPTVIQKQAMPVLADARAAVEQALARPVDSAPLRELARGKRSACVWICDITRPVPNGRFLPACFTGRTTTHEPTGVPFADDLCPVSRARAVE